MAARATREAGVAMRATATRESAVTAAREAMREGHDVLILRVKLNVDGMRPRVGRGKLQRRETFLGRGVRGWETEEPRLRQKNARGGLAL